MQKKPQCQYRKERERLTSLCGLNLYGGKVTDGNCRRCIKLGQNNTEFAVKYLAENPTLIKTKIY